MVKISFESSPVAIPEPKDMEMTTSAAEKLKNILASKPAYFLRVRVQGGGCNGYSYILNLDETRTEKDVPIQHPLCAEPVAYIDSESLRYLSGSTLDFEETIEASRFVIHNPNATSSCGCGNSFGL